jgi:hypothetical protein
MSMKHGLYHRITPPNTSNSRTYHTEFKYTNILPINTVTNKHNVLLTNYHFSIEICFRENIYKDHILSSSCVRQPWKWVSLFGMWCHVAWCICINILEEFIASIIFDTEDGGSILPKHWYLPIKQHSTIIQENHKISTYVLYSSVWVQGKEYMWQSLTFNSIHVGCNTPSL